MHRIPNALKMGAIMSCAMVAYAAAAGIDNEVATENVITYHGAADRSGLYVAPTLTWTKAATVKLDTNFHAGVDGWVYAQPLYWVPPGGTGRLIVATEQNFVYALTPRPASRFGRKGLALRFRSPNCRAATSTRWASPARR
jgi:hypothetical protein